MANMTYCRFRNTLLALRDCYENLPEELSEKNDPKEFQARRALVELCYDMIEAAYGEGIEHENHGLTLEQTQPVGNYTRLVCSNKLAGEK